MLGPSRLDYPKKWDTLANRPCFATEIAQKIEMARGPKSEKHTLFYKRDLLNPKEWLNFVELDPFTPAWKRLGLGDEDLRALQISICSWPDHGSVMSGTGGLRKIRFAPESWKTGLSGAARV